MAKTARRAALLSFLLLLLGPGCASDTEEPACIPDAARWESDIQPLVARHCGTCHGEEPDFGAPISLTAFEDMLSGPEGMRHVDRMVARLMDGSMPPVGMPRPPDASTQAIVDWASCGTEEAPPAVGLRSSAPVFLAPEEGPEGLETVDLLAPDFPVGEDVLDLYQCFVFDSPFDTAKFVRRFEMVVDESRVLHHVVLLRDTENNAPDEPFTCFGMPEGSDYLYAWAPGQGAVEFPEGGLRWNPGERYVMQVHYNNGAAVPDVTDESGVRLYVSEPEGTEYGMLAVGPLDFEIPARSTGSAESACTFRERTEVLAGMPHMHEIGASFLQRVEREGGAEEPFISLDGWSFETQLFYEHRTVFEPGDRLYTECTWDNPLDRPVRSGTGTSDEMCFNFMYVTPPPPSRYCDEMPGGAPTDVEYEPGSCAPADLPEETVLAEGPWRVGQPPVLNGGDIPDGTWRLTHIEFWTAEAETPLGTLDTETSSVLSRGFARTEAGRLTVDTDTVVHVANTAGLAIDRESELSTSGTFAAEGTSPFTLTTDCPEGETGATEVFYEATAERLTLGFEVNASGLPLSPRYVFEPVP